MAQQFEQRVILEIGTKQEMALVSTYTGTGGQCADATKAGVNRGRR